MLLLQAHHLFPERLNHRAQRIRRRSIRIAVIDRVHPEEQVFVGDVVIDPRRPEVFSNALQRIAKGLRDAAAQVRPVLHRPQRQQWLHRAIHTNIRLLTAGAGKIAQPRLVIRNQRHIAQV
jgi:hypothetical protein